MRTPKSFEAGMARLEEILAAMQSDQTPLAELVKLYAEAAALIEFCNATLQQATVQIQETDARIAGALGGNTEEGA